MQSFRPTSALQKRKLSTSQLARTQQFPPSLTASNKFTPLAQVSHRDNPDSLEFFKQTSKPFTKQKDKEDLQPSDLASVYSSIQSSQKSQSLNKEALEHYLLSIKDKYDFPVNFGEVCSQTESQVRSKLKNSERRPDLDLVSVYSDIRHVELEFEEK